MTGPRLSWNSVDAMALQGDGYRVLGVTLDGPAPLGRVHLEFNPGVSVLYGLNGAGKTRMLTAMRATLAGLALEGGRGMLHVEIEEPEGPARPGFVSGLSEGVWLGALREERGFAEEDAVTKVVPSIAISVKEHLLSVDYEWVDAEVAAGDAAARGYFSLEAVGVSEPRWRVWIADRPELGSPLEDALQAVQPLVRAQRALLRRLAVEHRMVTDRIAEVPVGVAEELADLFRAIQSLSPWYDSDATGLLDFNQDFPISRPSWVPVQWTAAGETDVAPVLVVDVDVTRADVDGRTLEALASQAGSLFSEGDSVRLNDNALGQIARLEETATRHLRSVLGPAFDLHFDLRSPVDWFLGKRAQWVCDDEYGQTVPLAHMSAARGRWAAAAIGLALGSGIEGEDPSVLLADEPESGIHRSAEKQVVDGLAELVAGSARTGFVATHSPAFLADPRASLLHVRRDLYGGTEVIALDGLPEVEDFGLTKGDLLALRRVFVLVEGEHDLVVLGKLFKAELEQAFAKILVLRGASQGITAAHAEWLLNATDAPLLLVFDKLGPATVEDWSKARALAADGRIDDALAVVKGLKTKKSDEAGFLSRLGEAALRTGTLNRLSFYGLPKDDILNYLPDAQSLFELKRKKVLTTQQVVAAVGAMDEIHPDLTALMDEISRLSRWRTHGAG